MPTDPRDPTSPVSRRDGRRDQGIRADQADRRIDGDDFWGDAETWADVAPQRRPSHDGESGGRLGRWWKSVAGAGSTASRTHGSTSPEIAHDEPTPAVGIDPFFDLDLDPATTRAGRQPSNDAVVAGANTVAWHDREDHAAWDVDAWDDDAWHDERGDDVWDVEPAPVRGAGIDPLIARLGAAIVVVTIAASIVMSFTSGADTGDQLLEVSAAVTTPVTTPVTAETNTGESTVAATQATTSPAAVAPNAAASGLSATTAAPSSTGATTTETSEADGQSEALVVAPEPATTAPACGSEYELAAGDYWIRIADAAGVSLADLLAVNDASVDTVLVPGRSICLPAGASTPAPPTTVAPPVTTAPANTTVPAKTTAPANTSAPSRPTATTVAPAPTTTVPARPTAVPVSQAEAIIRDVWPDDLEERALEIARRESNLRSNVNNWCCYGLFQIHWEAHRSWLATIGVTSVEQLYDPLVNASAAYTLYQRSGGFGPWGG